MTIVHEDADIIVVDKPLVRRRAPDARLDRGRPWSGR